MNETSYKQRVEAATVYDVAIQSPLDFARNLSARVHNRIWLKREDLQPVFSFKLRGAYNKIAALPDDAVQNGIICSSAGNHAQGVALAAQRRGIRAVIVMPVTTPSIKVDSVIALGGEVVLHGDNYDEAYARGRKLEKEQGLVFIHPFDDPDVIAGQGTIGAEILNQASEDIDAIFVPVGGGGLIAGIAAYLKPRRPAARFVAASPVNSPVMIRSLEAGRVLELESQPTLSDGTAGGVEPDAITFELCQALIDESVTVTEGEIREALGTFLRHEPTVIEGSAAVALAALRQRADAWSGKDVAVVLCGGNVDPALVEELR